MKVFISGIGGRMGDEVVRACSADENVEIVGGYDLIKAEYPGVKVYSDWNKVDVKADVIIDFSHHLGTAALLDYAKKSGTPVVLATTGHTDEELDMISEAAESVAIFRSANMSVGIALLCELAKTVAKSFPDADIEIIEKHHNRKLDAPSGTAILLADEIKSVREKTRYVYGRSGHAKRTPDEIGIHAVRMGNVVGDHEIIVATDSQTITLKHEAHSRALFAEGSVAAAKFLSGKSAGMYNMKSMLAE